MKFRATYAGAAAAALSLGLGLTACGGSSGSGGSSKEAVCKLPDKGPTVKVGVKFDQPGLGLKDGDKYTGFDVDIARCVAGELGYSKVDFVQSPSPQREKMLQAGTVKMIVATYSITDKRLKEVGFAGPYFVAGQSLLVSKDSKIDSVKGLAGKKVCSVTGSTSVDNLKKEQPNLVPQKYDTYSACAEALASGSIDAMTTDDTILAGYANQSQYKDKFKLVGGTFSEENYGIGLKKGAADCQKVADAIKKTVDNGNWQKALDNNLGSDYKYNSESNPPKTPTCQA